MEGGRFFCVRKSPLSASINMMVYFTPQEKRALVFLCCVVLAGSVAEAAGKHFRRSRPLPGIYYRVGKLDLNRAGKEELCSLPGIGEKLAERICVLRARRGGFGSIGELKEVEGIGEAKYGRLKDFFYLEGEER